jgi:hypothetical protein
VSERISIHTEEALEGSLLDMSERALLCAMHAGPRPAGRFSAMRSTGSTKARRLWPKQWPRLQRPAETLCARIGNRCAASASSCALSRLIPYRPTLLALLLRRASLMPGPYVSDKIGRFREHAITLPAPRGSYWMPMPDTAWRPCAQLGTTLIMALVADREIGW